MHCQPVEYYYSPKRSPPKPDPGAAAGTVQPAVKPAQRRERVFAKRVVVKAGVERVAAAAHAVLVEYVVVVEKGGEGVRGAEELREGRARVPVERVAEVSGPAGREAAHPAAAGAAVRAGSA